MGSGDDEAWVWGTLSFIGFGYLGISLANGSFSMQGLCFVAVVLCAISVGFDVERARRPRQS